MKQISFDTLAHLLNGEFAVLNEDGVTVSAILAEDGTFSLSIGRRSIRFDENGLITSP